MQDNVEAKKNRITKLNRQILLILGLLKDKEVLRIKVSDVMKMVNQTRAVDVAPNNFRSTCWRMKDELGYMSISRDKSNRLWCSLTDTGVEVINELNIKEN